MKILNDYTVRERMRMVELSSEEVSDLVREHVRKKVRIAKDGRIDVEFNERTGAATVSIVEKSEENRDLKETGGGG